MTTNPIRQKIQEQYDDFTPVEKRIADYLLGFAEGELPAAKTLAGELFVSEAALTRFAKLCGCGGYRELSFRFRGYADGQENSRSGTGGGAVSRSYENVLRRSFAILSEEQLVRVAAWIAEAKKILIVGIGNSGIAAREYFLRLRRVGLSAEVADEAHLMRILASLAGEGTLVLALSVSGSTKETQEALRLAHSHGARTVLITSSTELQRAAYCDELLRTGGLRYLDTGVVISPQIPLLITFDLLYDYLMRSDSAERMSAHSLTASALGVRSAEIRRAEGK